MEQVKISLPDMANIMSGLPLAEASGMFNDCIKQYGLDVAVKIVKLAEVYKQTKCGEVEREEALRVQNEILKEVTK